MSFPIQEVTIDWYRLIDKRPLLSLETLDTMLKYLLKPEVLAITPASFHDDSYDFGVVLKTLKQGAGRQSKHSLQRSLKRYIPILDRNFQTRIQSYLWMGKFRKDERIFLITRQSVSANIDRLIHQVGGRGAVQDWVSHLSAQLRGASVAARAAIEVCEPTARASKRRIHRGVHECAHVRRSAFFGRG
jgi:hypothetical protein